MPQYHIFGGDIQFLKVILAEGESIYADAGHMVAKKGSVQMKTKMQGGLLGALKRELTGETFFVTEFIGPGDVYLSSVFPGKIVQIPLQGNGILAKAHSFLAAESNVKYDIKLTKISVGWLAKEGMFLAKFRGEGNVFLHGHGDVVMRELKDGEELQVEASHLLAFEEGMDYGVKFVGGIKSLLFAHEGLFFINIRGPGRVWIQSLTTEQLVALLMKYISTA